MPGLACAFAFFYPELDLDRIESGVPSCAAVVLGTLVYCCAHALHAKLLWVLPMVQVFAMHTPAP